MSEQSDTPKPVCEECRGTGYFGDQGAGLNDYNSEYTRCDCRRAPRELSDTPRTDAICRRYGAPSTKTVPASFARTLEREIAAAKGELENWKECNLYPLSYREAVDELTALRADVKPLLARFASMAADHDYEHFADRLADFYLRHPSLAPTGKEQG